MLRITSNDTLLGLAVRQCTAAGCSAIWICCDEQFQPIIKQTIGDFTKDPKNVAKSMFTRYPKDNQVEIPIYYYLIHPKDRTRRSGPVWNPINTMLMIYHFSKSISRWTIPEKYFIVRPSSVISTTCLLDNRDIIASKQNVMATYSGSNFLTDEDLPFTLNSEQVVEIIFNLKNNSAFKSLTNVKYSDIMEYIDIDKYKKIELEQYFPCRTWDEYKNLITNYKQETS
tara:strand:+ start:130 stop:810 length:681 start_codon:yes stop_codon:yes gene_type:complete